MGGEAGLKVELEQEFGLETGEEGVVYCSLPRKFDNFLN